MKKLFIIFGMVVGIYACQENDSAKKSIYTGNESVYPLLSGSAYSIDGKVTFKERTDGTADIIVAIKGTEGDVHHPVHLHLGDMSIDGASVAALLTPVFGKTGKSETHLTRLVDESSISYKDLVKLNACIKVHLSDLGTGKDIVLAGGNVGIAAASSSTSRIGMATCKSE